MILSPFFSYYGAKWRIADLYPEPRYDRVIEPFAGAAGYSLHYAHKNVILYDVNPVVYGVWNYLIGVKEEEIRALPVKGIVEVSDLNICQEAKWLIGFWLAKGRSTPANKPTGWVNKEKRLSRGYWGPQYRERIAKQLKHIRHWKVVNSSWNEIPDYEATWYVDPPYSNSAGRAYPFHDIDYPLLGAWCERRKGQVIACDGPGANWLPFRVLTMKNKSSAPKDGKAVFKAELFWTKSDVKVGFGLN